MTDPVTEPESTEGEKPGPDPANTSIDQLVAPLDPDDDIHERLSGVA